MNTIAFTPPRPRLDIPRRPTTVSLCTSCDKALDNNGDCDGCSR